MLNEPTHDLGDRTPDLRVGFEGAPGIVGQHRIYLAEDPDGDVGGLEHKQFGPLLMDVVVDRFAADVSSATNSSTRCSSSRAASALVTNWSCDSSVYKTNTSCGWLVRTHSANGSHRSSEDPLVANAHDDTAAVNVPSRTVRSQ